MNYFDEILARLSDEKRLRVIPDDIHHTHNGKLPHKIDLLSNDYLGLAVENAADMPNLSKELFERFPHAFFSSSASRLLSRNQVIHSRLEDLLYSLYGRPALTFNSGYHANTGCMDALARPDTLLVVDKLMHASAIDGIRMASSTKGNFIRFPHNDIDALSIILKKNKDKYRKIIVVTESIFSMDGDLAPLREIVELKHTFPEMMIYLDEAHAFGVRGEKGLGLAEEYGLINDIDIIAGTLGKAAASAGAFVIAEKSVINYLLNSARSFIFSTALPPINQAWSIMMIEKIITMKPQRAYLQQLSGNLALALRSLLPHIVPPHAGSSQIIPLLCGNAEKAISIAHLLLNAGYDCLPIRRPTVPPGGERIRLSLNASLKLETLLPMVGILSKVINQS